jgi:hypothetical protein
MALDDAGVGLPHAAVQLLVHMVGADLGLAGVLELVAQRGQRAA